ncbi:hypothetical protein DS2_07663 [Catenovulum agarivorans DS-2]|uniref:Uncharacterized protein n=1 Tax=Catenovulum agarivorans DS-2 TaxID=1328313 RepID=W7QRJ0_9ALTE|nr:hypothetical protein [Catenovulum agarivorans]EWH10493.1 hypothetical protein DS2_07663 [Catenovulum agarivorans DS-2]
MKNVVGQVVRKADFWSANSNWKICGIKITSISIEGVEFGDGDVLDYKVAFKRLIKDLDQDKKLIIMIDEFAQTIENIIQYQDVQNALSLLKAHRELRQDTELSTKQSIMR